MNDNRAMSGPPSSVPLADAADPAAASVRPAPATVAVGAGADAGGEGGPALWREAVGRRLRRARQAAGLTLAELAQRSGVPLSTVSKIELGRHAASHEKLVALAAALGPGPALLWPAGLGPASAGSQTSAGPGGAGLSPERAAAPTADGADGSGVTGRATARSDALTLDRMAPLAGRDGRPLRRPGPAAGPRAVRTRLEDAPRLSAPPTQAIQHPREVAAAHGRPSGGSDAAQDDTARLRSGPVDRRMAVDPHGVDRAAFGPAADQGDGPPAGLWRALAVGFGGAVMRPFHQVVLARAPAGGPALDAAPDPAAFWQRHDGQCLVHVLGGAVLLALDDGARWPLSQGQSVYLAAGVGHRCWSTSARPAELLWVLGPDG